MTTAMQDGVRTRRATESQVIECIYCGKRHRDESKVQACQARAERAAKALEKKEKDKERREKNLALSGTVEAYVVRRYAYEGATSDKVAAELKKDFPPPDVARKLGDVPWAYKEWTAVDVLHIVAQPRERKLNAKVAKPRRRSRLLDKYRPASDSSAR